MGRLGARLLSFILCFQLAVSCNTYETSTTVTSSLVPVPEGFIRFNGILSKTFNLLSDSVMSSAVAAEGTITVYDINDPNAPKVIHSQTISGRDDFSIDLKEEVSSGLIGVHFESTEDPLKNRLYLTEVAPEISADMNQAESLKAEILFNQISQEVSESMVGLDAVKERFANLNKEFDLDVEVARFGSETGVKNLVLKDADSRKEMVDLLVASRLVTNSKDDSTMLALRNKFYDVAQRNAAIENDFFLNCDHTGASVFLSKDRDFYLEAEAVEPGLIEKSQQNWTKNSDILKNLNVANSRIQELMDTLKTYYEKYGEVYSLKISFQAADPLLAFPKNECRIFPSGIGEKVYAKAILSDPSVNFQFDKKLFDLIDVSTLVSLPVAKLAYANAVDQSVIDLENRLIELSVSPVAISKIIENQKMKALFYSREKLNELSFQALPSQVTYDPIYLQSVNLANAPTLVGAYEALMTNFDKTIQVLQNDLLVVYGFSKADSLPVYQAQVALAGQLLNERIRYFYDHFQVLTDSGLVPYHADLTVISALNPTDYLNLQDFATAFSLVYTSSMAAFEQRIINENLTPSLDDSDKMKNRFTMISKIKNHEATVYFKYLFNP